MYIKYIVFFYREGWVPRKKKQKKNDPKFKLVSPLIKQSSHNDLLEIIQKKTTMDGREENN